ncbi:adenylate/guanylate cyclase domain-containing protein [Roseibium sp. RKSG952]|uniref:adenylate/guanylate cyclase domain-containing protein n=1 Tax=Roseibium sp. RKSG952 TaxID=2529384 RepID=UPI0012BC46FE|nr:adenylate/guanylate cyclase domain-containing protein [Roseibium sp. RKSG952]MTH96337.1 adenylate/guanylate cyclase domain-containing protein [Roseibium sp. RKSG952]
MQRARRRLAAVMCADVAHYSRLMEADEDRTLDRLKHYRQIMAGLTGRHSGRIVNTWGDAVIVEFASVVEAVQCAVDIQNELAVKNADLPDAQKMQFRIGINLGDLMVEGDDIYGDGVNIAARLQEMAPTGGIMLSQSVYDQVRSKLAFGFEPLGRKKLKNVSEPVGAFSVRLGGRNEPDTPIGSDAGHDNAGEDAARQSRAAPPDPVNGFGQARAWLAAQPRRVRASIFMILFFLVLNILTSGLSSLWFYWPSLPFIVALIWHLLAGRGGKPASAPRGMD